MDVSFSGILSYVEEAARRMIDKVASPALHAGACCAGRGCCWHRHELGVSDAKAHALGL